MAYAQWINVEVQPRDCNLQVRNARLEWGKFYAHGSKDKEISSDAVNAMSISSDNTGYICSCGRADSASGTEGHFDLYDGDAKIGTFYWNCPWGAKQNTIRWETAGHDDYIAQVSGGNLDSGAIGPVRIKVVKI